MNDRLGDLSSHVTKSYRVDLTIDPLCYVTDDRNDLMMDVMMDVNRDHHTNDRLDDQSLDVNHANRSCVHRDPKTGGNLNVSRDRRMSDLLDDRNLDDDRRDALDGHHKNVMDDRNDLKTDGNHVNRNYAPRDLMMDGTKDAMSRHVKSMVYLSMSCDRMSHDHLRCDRQMMRHRDTNRMDGMNLDGKMKNHHVIHLTKGDHLMVCLMRI
jgi:hypothetical protein